MSESKDGLTPEDEQEEGKTIKLEPTEAVKESFPKESEFEHILKGALEQNTQGFYESVLKQADEKIKSQDVQIAELQEAQVTFRDEIAMRCFVPLIDTVEDYQKAAHSSYQAADAFLRARESGCM